MQEATMGHKRNVLLWPVIDPVSHSSSPALHSRQVRGVDALLKMSQQLNEKGKKVIITLEFHDSSTNSVSRFAAFHAGAASAINFGASALTVAASCPISHDRLLISCAFGTKTIGIWRFSNSGAKVYAAVWTVRRSGEAIINSTSWWNGNLFCRS